MKIHKPTRLQSNSLVTTNSKSSLKQRQVKIFRLKHFHLVMYITPILTLSPWWKKAQSKKVACPDKKYCQRNCPMTYHTYSSDSDVAGSWSLEPPEVWDLSVLRSCFPHPLSSSPVRSCSPSRFLLQRTQPPQSCRQVFPVPYGLCPRLFEVLGVQGLLHTAATWKWWWEFDIQNDNRVSEGIFN